MMHLIIEMRWLLAGAAGLGLITGFMAKRVSKPKRKR